MFDALHNLPNTKIVASYILHIAANPPDNSKRPLWNDSVIMDDVSWNLLPHEFKNVGASSCFRRPTSQINFLEEHFLQPPLPETPTWTAIGFVCCSKWRHCFFALMVRPSTDISFTGVHYRCPPVRKRYLIPRSSDVFFL